MASLVEISTRKRSAKAYTMLAILIVAIALVLSSV